MEKFRNKYRVESSRLQNWDYGSNGDYFITICTQGFELFFGKIVEGRMILNDVGLIANDLWQIIPEHFNFVKLDSFIVMPNHVHGIVCINKPGYEKSQNATGFRRFQNQGSQTLSSIIGSYKSAVTKSIHKIINQFSWQSRFHDHIIQDSDSYFKIKHYIENNPKMWNKDKFYKP